MSKRANPTRERPRQVISTGVVGLDEVLGGGLRPARFYLALGDPGVGKTTLGLQFLLEGRKHGEPCLYASLSETRAELEDIADSHGWSLDGVDTLELHAGDRELDAGDVQTMFHPAEVDLEEFVAPLLHELDRSKPRRAVIDSLSELRILAQDQRRFRRQVMALKERFARLGITALLLDDRTSESVEQVPQTFAHGVLMLEAVRREYGVPRRRLSVPKLRGAHFHEGYHDFRILTGGLVVYPRLVTGEPPARGEPGTRSSGVPALDAMLGGGLRRGTSTLVSGPAGVGKSVLVTQYAFHAAARGEGAALFIFDESREAYLTRAAGAGMDLAPHLASGRVHVVQVNPAEMTPGQFAHTVQDAVTRGARVVAIDSLNGYLSSVPEEAFLALHLHELLTYLGRRGVTTLLTVAQSGILGRLADTDVDVSYLADTVVAMRFFEADGEMRKVIAVPKMRSGFHELTLREYRIDRTGLHVGDPVREFEGVLTGTPTYVGPHTSLLRGEHHAGDG